MKNIKTVIATLLMGTLLPFSVSAAKTESVYINMDYTGNVTKTSVSNHIENSKKGEIEDNSLLTNIININGNESFKQDDKYVTWYAEGKDIFYTGTSKEGTPINVVTKYYLNGKETNATEIVGKSGKIKVEISLLNNSLLNTNNNFTPYVVMLGTVLDSDTNSNISITNGKVTDTGTRTMAFAISAPGIYEYTNINEFKSLNKVTITYETTNFEINDIYMVASPKILSDLDLDVFDKVGELSTSIDSLSSGMDELESGTKELGNGTNTLLTSSSLFNEKLNVASNALKQISDGSVLLVSGVDQIIEALNDAQSMLNNKDISGSLTNLQVLKATNEATISKLSSDEVDYAYKAYDMKATETESDMKVRLKEKSLDDTTITNLVTVKSTYELRALLVANNTAITQMISNLEEISTLMDKLTTKAEDIKVMKTKVEYLSSSLNEVSNGLIKLNEAAKQMNDGISTLNDGVTKVYEGTSKINEEGIKTLVSYTNKIVNYSNKFENLINLSKSYKGYASNNADSTLFIYKLSK